MTLFVRTVKNKHIHSEVFSAVAGGKYTDDKALHLYVKVEFHMAN
jgi:hypothetical protein